MGTYDARAVANEILAQGRRLDQPVTHLSLQKVCFFVHGLYMANGLGELVKGEFEAWKFGPVHRVLFHALQAQRDAPLTDFIRGVDPISGEKKPPLRVGVSSDATFICDTASFFLTFTAGQLVELSHAAGSPWDQVWETSRHSANIGMRIPNSLVRDFYKQHRLRN